MHILQVCKMAEVECPEGCGAKMQRGKLSKHKSECPDEVVNCAFSEHGCKVRGKRRKVGEHEQDIEGLRTHLQLVVQTAKVLNRVLGDQKQLNASLQAQQYGEKKVLWRIEDFTKKAIGKEELCSQTFSVTTNIEVYELCLELQYHRRKNSLTQGFIGIFVSHHDDFGGSKNFPLGLMGTSFVVQKGAKRTEGCFDEEAEELKFAHYYGFRCMFTADKIDGLIWDNDDEEVEEDDFDEPEHDITEFLEGDTLTLSATIKITPPEVVQL
mmetsp:Transcript_38841/g.60679  ORF Transcript_38841/g.60679 Transcript_38841/m.60679 type:complete len:268 (-) Transcript_38841:177-980(-)